MCAICEPPLTKTWSASAVGPMFFGNLGKLRHTWDPPEDNVDSPQPHGEIEDEKRVVVPGSEVSSDVGIVGGWTM